MSIYYGDTLVAGDSSTAGTAVTVTPTITTGTKIADITVNGDKSTLYAPAGFGIIPVGTILTWAGLKDKIPKGFLPCDGQDVSSILYSELYAVLGGKYGSNGLNKTFKIPDLNNDRYPVGSKGENTDVYLGPELPNIIGEFDLMTPLVNNNNFKASTAADTVRYDENNNSTNNAFLAQSTTYRTDGSNNGNDKYDHILNVTTTIPTVSRPERHCTSVQFHASDCCNVYKDPSYNVNLQTGEKTYNYVVRPKSTKVMFIIYSGVQS